jgi:DNA transformation protein
MPVSEGFREYALEQLRRAVRVTDRRMFGGIGIYSRGRFFALIDDDTLFFKVDDSNRPDYVERGMGPFRPFKDQGPSMSYYEVPAEVLEDPEELRGWIRKSLAAASRAKKPPARAGRAGKGARRARGIRSSRAGRRGTGRRPVSGESARGRRRLRKGSAKGD